LPRSGPDQAIIHRTHAGSDMAITVRFIGQGHAEINDFDDFVTNAHRTNLVHL